MIVPYEAWHNSQTVEDLLEARDILREETERLNPVTKDLLLSEMATDPDFAPSIAMNGLLQRLANDISDLGNRYLEHGSTDHTEVFPDSWRSLRDTSDEIIDFGDSLAHSDTSARTTLLSLTNNMRPELFHRAHIAANRAESYRRHNVGAVGVYIDADRRRAGILTSFNVKPHDLEPKYCAERGNWEKSEEERFDFTYCIAMVIYSLTPQPDPATNIKIEVEPPCGWCRLDMYTNPKFDENTLIICVAPNGRQKEWTLGELIRAYGIPDPYEQADRRKRVQTH